MTVTALQAAPRARVDLGHSAASPSGPLRTQAETPLPPAQGIREPLRAVPAPPQARGHLALSAADALRISEAMTLARALRDGAHPASLALRESLDALQRDRPELYQRALDMIVADFYASTNRVAYARALLANTAGPCCIDGDLYERIGPQQGVPEGKPLAPAELAQLGTRLSSAELETLPRAALRDVVEALDAEAGDRHASAATIDAAVRARVSLLRTCPLGDTSEADQDALAQDMRFAFGPKNGADRSVVDGALPAATRADLQRTMLGRAEALLESGDPSAAAQVHDALAGAGADTLDLRDRPRLQTLAERAAVVGSPPVAAPFANPVSVRETPEFPLPWLADGLDVFLRSDAADTTTRLVADTPNVPAPVAATFRARLEQAIKANIERGGEATRAITLDIRDATGDHRVYTYDLQRYHNAKKKDDGSNPHLHASGLRFASEAGRAQLAAIRTRDAAVAYANRVIDTVARERIADNYTPLTDSQRVAIRDGIVGWLNLAAHHEMPVNPVLRIIDEAQRVTSLNRALNINLETGHEQKVWANGKYDRLSGLTSSTLRGDQNGDGKMDFFSNILNRRAFELGFFHLHLYRGHHGRTLQQDGVNPRFQSQWDPQLAAMHVASYVRRGPPVVSGRSNMCDAVEDSAASRSAIVDFDGAMMFRHAMTDNAGVAKRWHANVRRQDYTGRIWHDHDEALGWGPIPGYTPVPKTIYPDRVRQSM